MKVGETFDNWKLFYEALCKWRDESFQPLFSFRETNRVENQNKKIKKGFFDVKLKYKYCKIRCIHSGSYKSTAKKRLHQFTFKTGCGAYIDVKAIREIQKLVITKIDLNHSHEVNKEIYSRYPQNRALRKADSFTRQEVAEMIQTGSNIRKLCHFLEGRTKQLEDPRALINFKHKLRRRETSNLNDAQALIDQMLKDQESKSIEFIFHKDDDDIFKYAFWQSNQMKITFDKYNKVICVDATYNLNRCAYPVYLIITIDANRDTRIVAFGIVSSEKKPDIIKAFFSWFNENNPKFREIKTIVSDKHENQIKCLKNLYKDADISLCLYHVFKALRSATQKKLPNNIHEKVRGILAQMAYSNEIEDFQNHYDRLKQELTRFPSFIKYFEDNWISCVQQWATCYRERQYNLGETTNNRIESLNCHLKKLGSFTHSLVDCYKALNLSYEHFENTRSFLIFKELVKGVNFNRSQIPEIIEIEPLIYKTVTQQLADIIVKQLESAFNKSIEILQLDNVKFKISTDGHRDRIASINECNCFRFINTRLPCFHIFSVRKYLKIPLFVESLISVDDRKEHYIKSLASHGRIHDFTSDDKLLFVKKETDKLAYIIVNSDPNKFEEKMKILKELMTKFSEEIHTSIEEPTKDESILDTNEDSDIEMEDTPTEYQGKERILLKDASKEKPAGRPSTLTAIGKTRIMPKPSLRKQLKKIIQTAKDQEMIESADWYQSNPMTHQVLHDPIELESDEVYAWNLQGQEEAKIWIDDSRFPFPQTENDYESIRNPKKWLRDDTINGIQLKLKSEFPYISGFQNTNLLLHDPKYPPFPRFSLLPKYGYFIQIINISGMHWICVAGKCEEQHIIQINVYDSLLSKENKPLYDSTLVSQISSFFRSHSFENFEFIYHSVSQQNDSSSCGVYAIANAIILANDGLPECHQYIGEIEMRDHLISYMESGEDHVRPFESVIVPPLNPSYICFKEPVYCYCRKIDDGSLMIQCVDCFEWFHVHCISYNIKENEHFICKHCSLRNKH